MSERFFRSNRPGYPHPVSSALEISGIRVAAGDCSVTERRRWRPPYQTGKTVHVHAKHYKHNEDGRTAPGVCGNGSVPLSHSGNVVTRIGTHTHTHNCWYFNIHEQENSIIGVYEPKILILLYFSSLYAFKISCSAELNMRLFPITSGPSHYILPPLGKQLALFL